MALVKCEECGNAISTQAAACPSCGAKNTSKPWGFGKKLIAGIFIFIVGSYVIGVVQQANKPSALAAKEDKEMAESLRATSAKDVCRSSVIERLKAPTTSEFPNPIRVSRAADGGLYYVTGNVDAQNSFGAKLRSKYLCEVVPGKEWSDNTVSRVSIN